MTYMYPTTILTELINNIHMIFIGESHFQEQIIVNVWAGIIGNNLLGPFFLPSRLEGR